MTTKIHSVMHGHRKHKTAATFECWEKNSVISCFPYPVTDLREKLLPPQRLEREIYCVKPPLIPDLSNNFYFMTILASNIDNALHKLSLCG